LTVSQFLGARQVTLAQFVMAVGARHDQHDFALAFAVYFSDPSILCFFLPLTAVHGMGNDDQHAFALFFAVSGCLFPYRLFL
jgi:hypothetical protein